MKVRFAVLIALSLAGGTLAQEELKETVAPNIPGVVKGGTPVRIVKSGFKSTEGPIALPDGSLVFTELALNRLIKIDRNDNVTTFLENTNGANSIGFDPKGRLIGVLVNEGQAGVAVLYPESSKAVLASTYEGKPLGRPNDLAVGRAGIYFTDPGRNAVGAPPEPGALPQAVYYLPYNRQAVIKVADGFRPNGILLSRDEKTIFINNTTGESLLAYDVRPDGTLTNRRDFAKYEGVTRTADGVNSGADGLAIDNDGRIYIAVPPGVQVLSPAGATLGVIPLSIRPQNLAFAGPDKQTLYVVGRGNAFKVQMLAQGFKGRAK